MLSAISSYTKPFKTNRRGGLALAAILGAAIAFATVQLARPGAPATEAGGVQGIPGPTLSDPLAAPATQTTMAAAVSAMGVSVPLPSASAVQSAQVGAVWAGSW